MSRRLAVWAARCACALALCLSALPAFAVSPDIVISQVYGGGGNTGAPAATLKSDYIELFNRGSLPVSVAGWSVQYASSTGLFTQVTNLAGTIQPGKYYLVKQATGSGGSIDLPTPDATGTIAMSATSGKVALVTSTAALNCGGVTACTSASIRDLVGFGSAATTFEGAGPTGTLNNVNAAFRGANGCTDTDSNNTDFTVAVAAPRNSATSANACGGPTNPTGVGAANPASGPVGASTLLTVTVTPGGTPTSTGLAVTANLTGIGGSATQAFFDDGTNGDVTAGNNVFSYSATVGAVVAGAKSLPFTIADAQSRSGNGTIAYFVDAPELTIAQIQGDGETSDYDGGLVKTTGIVTGVKSNGYFLQMADPGDGNPATSDGIFVFTNAAPPALAVVGNAVSVNGTVSEFIPSQDPNSPPVTEIVNPTTSPATGSGLPTPATLTAADTDPAGSLTQLERFEGMVVHVPSLTVVAPTDANVTESSATASSTGVFYGVVTGLARPYREPGIAATDPVPACVPGPCSAALPRFDENPEKIRVDSDAIGAPKLDVYTGTVVTGLTGPLDYGFRAYTIVQYPHVTATAVGTLAAIPTTDAFGSEFTVASANIERFYDTVNDAGISDVQLTPAAFANRLNKVSLMIREVLKSPDIIGVQEVENLGVLQAIAAKLDADSGGATDYVAYLQEGNDIGGIDVGFLVNTAAVGNGHQRVEVDTVLQYAKTQTYIDPSDGLPALLNDRPSLVLRADVFHQSGYASYPVTVVVNHLRSLNGVDDPADGNRIRVKRRAQAESLAALLQTLQGENVVSVGDYNAFQFSDGFVDSIGTLLGTPTPQNQVVLASPDLVEPDYTNVSGLEAAEDQYSFSFDGSAQELDHVLVNANALGQYSGLGHPRTNTDFPEILRNDASRPERISDHDPSVAYFLFPVTSTVTVAPDPQQYTDKVSFSVVVAPDSIQSASLLPATVEFFVGTLSMGTATLAAGPDGTLVATLADVALVESLPAANVAPGTHTVTAEFSNALIPQATSSLEIEQEDASAAYAGALFVSTACVSCANATVTLAATVTDDADVDTGDVRNATVTFVNLDTMTDISPALPVGLVNDGDTTVGAVSYEWAVNIAGNSQDFTVGVRVDGHYARDAQADAIVTVSKPLASYFITGGGYLTLSGSAGIAAGDAGSRNSFGYNVQYNKKGTNLQGRVNVLVRRTESDGVVHTYQIKGNVLTSLAVNSAGGTATFTGKASIRDVTDPSAPIAVDGNATLIMTMDDNGEPGSGDTLGIAVYNKSGGLWFSSNWTGTTTAQQALSGGNLIVH